MPNWCENQVDFHFADKREAQRFIDLCTSPLRDTPLVCLSFQKIYPLKPYTPDGTDWEYNAAIVHWGTKWDASNSSGEYPDDILRSLTASFHFDTAWEPPQGIYNRLHDIEFEPDSWFYREEGLKLAGYLEYDPHHHPELSLECDSVSHADPPPTDGSA